MMTKEEVAALTRLRSDLMQARARAEAAEARVKELEAQLAEAMKVIEPFAKAGELFSNVSPGEIEYDQCVYLPADPTAGGGDA